MTPTARWSDTLLHIFGSTPDAMVWSWQLSKFKETVSTATLAPHERPGVSPALADSAAPIERGLTSKRPGIAFTPPREHGAYAVLLIPLLTAFLSHGVTSDSVAIAVAAVAGFLAHEPLLVQLGLRGRRAKDQSPHAMIQACALIGLCVASGSVAFVTASALTRIGLFGCLAAAIVSFGLSWTGMHRSKFGHVLGVVALTAPVVPVLTAAGAEFSRAMLTWSVWGLGFIATTTAVHAVIAKRKQQPRTVSFVLVGSAAAASMALFVLGGEPLGMAPVPMILASAYLVVAPPRAKQLRRVGWALVSCTLASAMIFALA